jgi:hypothetical protein
MQFVVLHAYVFCWVAVCCLLFGSISYSLRLQSLNFHICVCWRNLLSNFTRIIKYSLVTALDWCVYTVYIYAMIGLLFPSKENIACTLLGETGFSETGKYLIRNETAVIVFFPVYLFPTNFLSFALSIFPFPLLVHDSSISFLSVESFISFCYIIFFFIFWGFSFRFTFSYPKIRTILY